MAGPRDVSFTRRTERRIRGEVRTIRRGATVRSAVAFHAAYQVLPGSLAPRGGRVVAAPLAAVRQSSQNIPRTSHATRMSTVAVQGDDRYYLTHENIQGNPFRRPA